MERRFAIFLPVMLLVFLALAGCGEKARYSLNIAIEGGPGCTVLPASGTIYPTGTVVELTAISAAGYVLDHWSGTDGASVTEGNTIYIDGDKNIVAVFARFKYDLTVDSSPAEGGTVQASLAMQPKSLIGIEPGQTVQLTAKANPGYVFDHWEGGLSGSDNPATLTLNEQPSQPVTACFVPGLSGLVSLANSHRGIFGISITAGDRSTTTDYDGYWQLKGVSFPVIVTASAPVSSGCFGAIFSPASVTISGVHGTSIDFAINARVFERMWGSSGVNDGQFDSPIDIAIDADGHLYVTDGYNHRIQVFDSDGTYLAKWGSNGSGNGQFSVPIGVAVDSNGHIYVVDYGNHRIQKFDSDGTYLTQWGSNGTGNGQFSFPRGIAVDAAGYVYVTDSGNNRVQKFSSDGTYLAKWGSSGAGNGLFNTPSGIAVHTSGQIIVADSNGFIQKFSTDGTYLGQLGSRGTGDGQFSGGARIAVDSAGHIYIAGGGSYRVQQFDAGGAYLCQWGSQGIGPGRFGSLGGIVVDSDGDVYVVDPANNSIQKFTALE